MLMGFILVLYPGGQTLAGFLIGYGPEQNAPGRLIDTAGNQPLV
jgi:hypothetical protein